MLRGLIDRLWGIPRDEVAESYSPGRLLEVRGLSLWVDGGKRRLLKGVNVKVAEGTIVAIVGPSGSGKSTLLRSINKTNFSNLDVRYEGQIFYEGRNILSPNYSVEYLRTQIGTVLQKPIMFPMTIRENVLYALRAHGISDTDLLEGILEESLKGVNLWNEVKDRLNSLPERTLSLGQQQRLCIARAMALNPRILLMDEPTSALDLKSSNKIEELILDFVRRRKSTVILVSHSLSQVKRVSNYTVFLKNGEVIEYGPTRDIFSNPTQPETRDFISGVH